MVGVQAGPCPPDCCHPPPQSLPVPFPEPVLCAVGREVGAREDSSSQGNGAGSGDEFAKDVLV